MLAAMICAAAADQPVVAATTQDAHAIQIDVRATVERVPDLAVVTLGVTGDASDSETALARHSQNVLRILAAIREAGIPAREVEQARPLVQPLYETWVEGNQERQGERIGYRANTRITLSLHDIPRAGRAIQAILRAGATYIDRIAFRLNDDHQAAARAEARAAAIATLCRQPLEVGAGCGNAARPDPCGGRLATAVPTANIFVFGCVRWAAA
jgi:uncharacterized protein YggE